MKRFNVEIIEITYKYIDIDAKNESEAKEKSKSMVLNDDKEVFIDLNIGNIEEVN